MEVDLKLLGKHAATGRGMELQWFFGTGEYDVRGNRLGGYGHAST